MTSEMARNGLELSSSQLGPQQSCGSVKLASGSACHSGDVGAAQCQCRLELGKVAQYPQLTYVSFDPMGKQAFPTICEFNYSLLLQLVRGAGSVSADVEVADSSLRHGLEP